MERIVDILPVLGTWGIRWFWIPLALWTVFLVPVWLVLHWARSLYPSIHLDVRRALLISLPLGVFLMPYLDLDWTFSRTPVLTVAAAIEVGQPVAAGLVATAESAIDFVLVAGIAFIAAVVLAAGYLVYTLWQIVQLVRLRRTLQLQHRPECESILREWSGTQTRLALRTTCYTTARDVSPLTFGWFRPVIVLPESLLRDETMLRLALLHEWTHVRRYDWLMAWIERIIGICFFAHPAVWRLRSQIEFYREVTCDDEVLEQSRTASDVYARLLYRFTMSASVRPALAAGLAESPSNLKKRIITMHILLNRKHSGRFVRRLAALIAMPVLGLGILVTASAQGLTQNEQAEAAPVSTGTEARPLYLVDGKPVANVDSIDPNTIESVHVYKGEQAVTKFGDKGKSGVVEVKTKKGVMSVDTHGQKVPLYLVNGVEQKEIDSIDPGDIISIEVLKDENAVARYGDRGKDGVVLVSTRNRAVVSPPDSVFTEVDEMPVLIGGIETITSTMRYPEKAKNEGLEGKVFITFVVDEKGQVTEAKVKQGVSPELDAEALRVAKILRFTPGKNEGKAVAVRMVMPFFFKLDAAKKVEKTSSIRSGKKIPGPAGIKKTLTFAKVDRVKGKGVVPPQTEKTKPHTKQLKDVKKVPEVKNLKGMKVDPAPIVAATTAAVSVVVLR